VENAARKYKCQRCREANNSHDIFPLAAPIDPLTACLMISACPLQTSKLQQSGNCCLQACHPCIPLYPLVSGYTFAHAKEAMPAAENTCHKIRKIPTGNAGRNRLPTSTVHPNLPASTYVNAGLVATTIQVRAWITHDCHLRQPTIWLGSGCNHQNEKSNTCHG
jgi:hypothetical protein